MKKQKVILWKIAKIVFVYEMKVKYNSNILKMNLDNFILLEYIDSGKNKILYEYFTFIAENNFIHNILWYSITL